MSLVVAVAEKALPSQDPPYSHLGIIFCSLAGVGLRNEGKEGQRWRLLSQNYRRRSLRVSPASISRPNQTHNSAIDSEFTAFPSSYLHIDRCWSIVNAS